MFLNHSRPGNYVNRYRQVSSIELSSVIDNYIKHFDLRHFFNTHIPASNNLLLLYI